jgi:hypothetical protein
MKQCEARLQRGQAMSEFVAALALFVPLVMGVVYLGKFSDVKHQAIQASRYAAFERALDPSASHESDAVLTEETRARFFTDGSRNSGKIGYEDSSAGLATSGSLNPVWSQMNGTPMITQYADVSVAVTQGAISSALLAPVDASNKLLFNLDGGGQVQANVEVPLANITHLAAPLDSLNLKIGATTVVAGDAWNSGGAADVASHFNEPSQAVPVTAFKPLNTPLASIFQLLSGTDGPQWGCIKADVVPGATAPGANYSAGDACN